MSFFSKEKKIVKHLAHDNDQGGTRQVAKWAYKSLVQLEDNIPNIILYYYSFDRKQGKLWWYGHTATECPLTNKKLMTRVTYEYSNFTTNKPKLVENREV